MEFPLPSSDNELLPEGAEGTIDIPIEKIQYLEAAYDLLQHPAKTLISNLCPDWIICDFSPYWVVQIAQEFQMNLMFYNVLSACALAFLGLPEFIHRKGKARTLLESFTVTLEWVTFPSSVVSAARGGYYRSQNLWGKCLRDSRWLYRAAKILEAYLAVAFRSCYEIEGEYLNFFEEISGKPVIPVGLYPLNMPESDNETLHSYSVRFFDLEFSSYGPISPIVNRGAIFFKS